MHFSKGIRGKFKVIANGRHKSGSFKLPKDYSPPPIPHDLVILILTFLEGDRAALAASSLVSRSWRDAAQPHFFRSITLTSLERLQYLEDLIESGHIVAHWITELQIDTCVNAGPLIDKSSWIYPLSSNLSSKLVGLRHIHLRHLYQTTPSDDDPSLAPLGAFSTVTRVTVEDCHLTGHTLFELLGSFTNLEDLQVRNFHYVEGGPRHTQPNNSLSLRNITVYIGTNPFDNLSPLLRWLAKTNSVKTISSARIVGVGGATVLGISVFLKELTELETLDVQFADSDAVRGTGNARKYTVFLFDHSCLTVLALQHTIWSPDSTSRQTRN